MQSKRYLLLAGLFILLVIAGLSIVALKPLVPALANIMMLLVGLFTMASLSAFHRLIETPERRPLIQITFNEQMATRQLNTAAKRVGVEVVDAEIVEPQRAQWDVSPDELLGQDNSLALAKLRIDIERELRRLATSAHLDATVARLGIRPLAEELKRRGVLDPAILSVIEDILPAANQAIHGERISTSTATVILRLGKQLIGLLQSLAKKREHAL